MIRRALIGERVALLDGSVGKVTGINTALIARVVLAGGTYRDVPQDDLRHLPMKLEGAWRGDANGRNS